MNDEIKKDQDGMIELYMDNPSLNDVTLTVDARISVPSGIHISGEGFGQTGSAGIVYGVFEVLPGNARTIYITVKAEKIGDFSIQFSGTYYPDDNKDAYQPISLTQSFKVIPTIVPTPVLTQTETVKYICPERYVLTADNRCIQPKETPGFNIFLVIINFIVIIVIKKII